MKKTSSQCPSCACHACALQQDGGEKKTYSSAPLTGTPSHSCSFSFPPSCYKFSPWLDPLSTEVNIAHSGNSMTPANQWKKAAPHGNPRRAPSERQLERYKRAGSQWLPLGKKTKTLVRERPFFHGILFYTLTCLPCTNASSSVKIKIHNLKQCAAREQDQK